MQEVVQNCLKSFTRVFTDNRQTERQITSAWETVDNCHTGTVHIIISYVNKDQ